MAESMVPPPKRRKAVIAAAVAAVLVLGAAAGWWFWSRASDGSPRTKVVAGTVQAQLLGLDDVSRLIGSTLTSGDSVSEPPPALTAEPANCSAAVGPASQAVYARGWTAFLSASYQDSDTVADHAVTQVLGVYPSAGHAAAVFKTLAEGVKGCTTAVRTDQDGETTRWTYSVYSADSSGTTGDALAWTAAQDAGDGWACYRHARLKGSVVLQAAVCGAGDGRQAAAKVAERMAERVTG
ncbi:sensor domain-containing protein [Kitasatospora sp. NPDC054939]